jgi:PAS domain S-box-containing protein
VTDILKDPLWDDFRELAVKHELRACWSSPILSHTGRVSGTFAMYYRVPRGPLPEEQRLTDIATHIASIAIDSRRTEESLREREERSRAIVRAIPDSMFVLNSDFKYIECEPRPSCRLSVPPEQIVGKNMRDVLPPELAEKFVRCFQEVSESGEPQLVEYHRSLNGQIQHNEARVVPTSDGRFLVVVRDITERRLVEEALRERESELLESNAKIRELAGKLMTAQEEERLRISRELHDDLNQQVAALSIMISHIKHKAPPEADSLKRELDRLQRFSVEITESIRRLSHELHPATLEHVGLAAALRTYVTEFSHLQKIQVRLKVPDTDGIIPQSAAVCLYRVAQESLRNIIKHSGANCADVTLSVDDKAVHLHVSDSGSGFDLAAARNNGGLGLASMEERVRLVQGIFRISTQPGRGSKVMATIPLRRLQP